MSGILAYAAKRTLIDRIDTLLASDAVQVAYAFPGDPERLCVYGGGLRFVRTDVVAEPGLLALETVTVDIWVRCFRPGDDVRAADESVEDLAGQIVDDLMVNPKLAGMFSVTSVLAGDAGFPTVSAAPEPAVTAQLLLQIVVEGDL